LPQRGFQVSARVIRRNEPHPYVGEKSGEKTGSAPLTSGTRWSRGAQESKATWGKRKATRPSRKKSPSHREKTLPAALSITRSCHLLGPLLTHGIHPRRKGVGVLKREPRSLLQTVEEKKDPRRTRGRICGGAFIQLEEA